MQAAPSQMRYRTGLEAIARTMNTQGDLGIEVTENERFLIWRMQRCYMCSGWHAEEAVCYPIVGMLEAAIKWMSDDKAVFRVVETECIAKGDAVCLFLIEKPL
jgi:predicted hydrocarbon binding protein